MNSIIEKLLKFKLENKNDIQIAELSNRFSERASYELVLINIRGPCIEISVISCLLVVKALSQFKKFCLFLRIYLHIRHIL